MYATEYGNSFLVGGLVANDHPANPTFPPEEAWNIDTKLDDGKPAYGKMIVRYWNNLCASADDGTSANNDLVASYRLSDKTPQCALIFRQAF